MKWSIRLLGDFLDLSEFAHSLTPPYNVTKRDDGFYYLHIDYDDIDHIEDSNIVLKHYEIAIINLNAIATLFINNIHSTFDYDNLVRIGNDNRINHAYIYGSEVIKMQDRVFISITVDGVEQEQQKSTKYSDWVKLGSKNENVKKVFQLINNKDNEPWVNLNRILEIIKSDIGGKNLYEMGWVTKTTLKSFTHTADNPGASGLLARHGASNNPAPSIPMSVGDAKSLVKNVVFKWLEHLSNQNKN